MALQPGSADNASMTAEPATTNVLPRLRVKLAFWVLVGMTSTAMAEVLSGSYPLPFVTWDGWIFVLPVYLLHSVLGIWAIQQFGRVNQATLYLAGMLFGFYEFYLTKVLWGAPWGSALLVGGIDVVALVILAAFWHPLFAFMFPLAITEVASTSSRTIAPSLPFNLGRPTKRVATTLLIVTAVVQGTVAPDPATAALSTVTTLGGLFLAFSWWRRDPRRRRWTLADLMPSGREVVGVVTATVVLYVFMFFAFNPNSIPGVGTQMLTWLLYAAVIGLFAAALRRSRSDVAPSWPGPPDWWPPNRLTTLTAYTVVVVAAAMTGLNIIGIALIWIPGFAIGLMLAWKSIRYAFGAQ